MRSFFYRNDYFSKSHFIFPCNLYCTMCIQVAEWLWMYCVIVQKTCWFCIISQWVSISGLCVYMLCILCINCIIYLCIDCIMHVGFVRWGNWEAILKADMKNTVCLCKLVIYTVFQECRSQSYSVQCAFRLLSYVWNVLCMYLRFVFWGNWLANLGLYAKYFYASNIFYIRVSNVLCTYVGFVRWGNWVAILEADIAWFFLPDYHRLVLPQQER